jgi:glycosyltransferase involved in cell wall biosynthesis
MQIKLLTVAGHWSGAEVHTLALAQTLRTRGHDVQIVELGHQRYASREDTGNANIVFLPLDEANSTDVPLQAISTRRWKSLLKNISGDVGILVKGDFNTGTAQLDRAARSTFGVYLTIEHLVFPTSVAEPPRLFGLPRPRLWLYRQRYRHWTRSLGPKLVIGVSEAMRATLISHYGFPARKVRFVQNGVDVERNIRDATARAATRAAWSISPDALVFGSVGRLSPMKNLRMALEAFARLLASDFERALKLVFVGDGPSRAELEAHARKLGVAHDVVFPGFSDRPFDAFCGLDVFVLPSHNEGLSLSMLEAMACECPPVATAVGGAAEVLNDARLGWLVRPGDTEHFFDAMRQAATMNSAALKGMGAAARKRVTTHFNGETQFTRLAEMIEMSAGS